jgi:hypothetical protein
MHAAATAVESTAPERVHRFENSDRAPPLAANETQSFAAPPAPQSTQPTICLTVKRTTGKGLQLTVFRSDTILTVKLHLEKLTNSKIADMMLLYAGVEMDDEKQVQEYCAQDGTLAVFFR